MTKKNKLVLAPIPPSQREVNIYPPPLPAKIALLPFIGTANKTNFRLIAPYLNQTYWRQTIYQNLIFLS